MNAHASLKPVKPKVMTHGQVLLAHGRAQSLMDDLYVMRFQPEGEPVREAHAIKAREHLEWIAKRMGLMLVPAMERVDG